jgi:hypothetical protein
MPQHSECTASRAFIPNAVRKSHVCACSLPTEPERSDRAWWRQSIMQCSGATGHPCMLHASAWLGWSITFPLTTRLLAFSKLDLCMAMHSLHVHACLASSLYKLQMIESITDEGMCRRHVGTCAQPLTGQARFRWPSPEASRFGRSQVRRVPPSCTPQPQELPTSGAPP